MCDWCGPVGDHDKPSEFGCPDHLEWQFTPEELLILSVIQSHVEDVRAGYLHGPAFGDISADDPICPVCGQQCHAHEPVGLCQRG